MKQESKLCSMLIRALNNAIGDWERAEMLNRTGLKSGDFEVNDYLECLDISSTACEDVVTYMKQIETEDL
jgi:hypothetical protein